MPANRWPNMRSRTRQAKDRGLNASKWTVGMLFVGVAISLYHLYYILYKETQE